MLVDDAHGMGLNGLGMGKSHMGQVSMAESATSAAAAAPLGLPSLKAPEGEDLDRVGRVSIAGHSPKTWLMSSVDTNGITIAVQWHGRTKTLQDASDPWGHHGHARHDTVSETDVAVTLERFEVEQNFVRTPSQSLTDKFKAIPLVSLQPSRGYFFELISLKPRNASRITFKNNHNGHQNRLVVRLTYTLILRGRGIGITQSIATNLVEVHTKNRYIGQDEMSRFRTDYMANLQTIKKTCEGLNQNLPVKVTSYLARLFAAEDELWQAYCKSRAKQKHVKARELSRKTRKRAMIGYLGDAGMPMSPNVMGHHQHHQPPPPPPHQQQQHQQQQHHSQHHQHQQHHSQQQQQQHMHHQQQQQQHMHHHHQQQQHMQHHQHHHHHQQQQQPHHSMMDMHGSTPPGSAGDMDHGLNDMGSHTSHHDAVKSPSSGILSSAHGAALSLPALTDFSEKFTNAIEEMSTKLAGLDRRMQQALGRLEYLERSMGGPSNPGPTMMHHSYDHHQQQQQQQRSKRVRT
eukprot:CAMPEP_0171547930 /NCGR_PEP_ID=MMETSP0960-20121227/5529_1 /TAXON_ID=87120 /ORGANISM="Aurantiochytrium limacinum, Strain ATCCMYA-1381" /LENGTH=515 /DNA_ID=CAMNT_0012096303 /DNA_START=2104 /DNA_END=3651 /DNA_ORIENTATION=-